MSWGKVKLNDICELITCGVAKRPDYVDDGIPFLSSLNVKENRFILKTFKRISIQDFQKLNKYSKPEIGDILYTRVGSFGEAAVINFDFDFSIFVSLTLIKPKKEIIDSCFLMWHLNSPTVRDFASKNTSGIGVQNLNVSVVRKYEIPLPPLPIQKQIAEILNKADALRKKDLELLKHYDALAQSLFIDMFGDPVKNEKRWKMKSLSLLGKLDRGVSKHRPRNAPELLGGEYPLIQTGDVANSGGIINSYKSTYSELGLKQSKLWPKGTLCITIAANIAKTGILNFAACFPDSIVGFVPNDESNNEFIQFIFSFLQKILEDAAPESAQKNINLDILRNLKIIAPPISLQNQFAEQIKNIELQKEKVKEEIKASENLFQALLQKMFS